MIPSRQHLFYRHAEAVYQNTACSILPVKDMSNGNGITPAKHHAFPSRNLPEQKHVAPKVSLAENAQQKKLMRPFHVLNGKVAS